MRGLIAWSLCGFIFSLGVMTVGGNFLVNVDLNPTMPKPESQMTVTCSFNISKSDTENIIIYDLNSYTICLFSVREGTERCNDDYLPSVLNRNLSYDVSNGTATLVLQLQNCTTLTGIRCAVTDVRATERSATTHFTIQNVPEPVVRCVDECEEMVDNGRRTLRFAENASQDLICSADGAKPTVTFAWSGHYIAQNNTTVPTDRCTYNQTQTASPSQTITSSTDVTCSVTAPDNTMASTTVTVTTAKPGNSGQAVLTTLHLIPLTVFSSILLK